MAIQRVRLNDATTTDPQQLLTRAQVARLLGHVSIWTIRGLEMAGKLKGFRLNSRRGTVYYKKTEVDRLIAEASGEDASTSSIEK